MNNTEYRIETVSYQNKKDHRILEACLSNWFKDPKTLQFTDPRMRFPFRINNWVNLSYQQPGIKTYIIKHERWIIGHLSVKTVMKFMSAHLFHLIIDSPYRRQGHAEKLLIHIENILQEKGISRITLNAVQNNKPAISLYLKNGYNKSGFTGTGSLKMEKSFSNLFHSIIS
tara:strand:+ start:245 stop:757 length:513 start_codon:yes stop_codon:yes gene_type:complete